MEKAEKVFFAGEDQYLRRPVALERRYPAIPDGARRVTLG
jgi:hypothetical protein